VPIGKSLDRRLMVVARIKKMALWHCSNHPRSHVPAPPIL